MKYDVAPLRRPVLHASVLAVSLFCIRGPSAFAAVKVETRELVRRVQVHAVTTADKAETISNPLHHPQFVYLVPDGSYVEKGDLISEFEDEPLTRAMRYHEVESRAVDARVEAELARIRDQELAMKDRLAALTDKIAVLHARLAYLRSMPESNKVAIATMRLAVAGSSLVGASNDLAKARSRFARDMASAKEVARGERAVRENTLYVDHASKRLDLVSQPASSAMLRKVAFEIDNVELESRKIEQDMVSMLEISETERKCRLADKELFESSIAETKEFMTQTKVVAPIPGYVLHRREFRNKYLATGNKMWRHMNYLLIPDLDSMGFKGAISEQDRQYFKEGDLARVVIAGHPDQPIEAAIGRISPLPRDALEKEESSFGGSETESGIIVYDIFLVPKSIPNWLKLGSHATCTLVSSTKSRGPCVPLGYLKRRGGANYLAVNGVYRRVSGRAIEGQFLLDDDTLEGAWVELDGRFADDDVVESPGISRDGLEESGELVPVDPLPVMIGQIMPEWQKLVWMVDEGSVVKKGDVVASLADAESRRWLEETRIKWVQATGERDAARKRLKMAQRDLAFRSARASNLVDIAMIELASARDARDWSGILKSELNLGLAVIRIEELDERIERAANDGFTRLSPVEISALRHERERAMLTRNLAELDLKKRRRGPDEVALREAEVELASRRFEYLADVREAVVGVEDARADLERKSKAAAVAEFRRKPMKVATIGCTLYSPGDGVVEYQKIWNSHVLSKVNVGSEVGREYIIMTVSDLSRLHTTVSVPERYLGDVKQGMDVKVRIPSLKAVVPGRVTKVGYFLGDRPSKTLESGLYAGHEPLGEVVFGVSVELLDTTGLSLEPGMIVTVVFPFGGELHAGLRSGIRGVGAVKGKGRVQ